MRFRLPRIWSGVGSDALLQLHLYEAGEGVCGVDESFDLAEGSFALECAFADRVTLFVNGVQDGKLNYYINIEKRLTRMALSVEDRLEIATLSGDVGTDAANLLCPLVEANRRFHSGLASAEERGLLNRVIDEARPEDLRGYSRRYAYLGPIVGKDLMNRINANGELMESAWRQGLVRATRLDSALIADHARNELASRSLQLIDHARSIVQHARHEDGPSALVARTMQGNLTLAPARSIYERSRVHQVFDAQWHRADLEDRSVMLALRSQFDLLHNAARAAAAQAVPWPSSFIAVLRGGGGGEGARACEVLLALARADSRARARAILATRQRQEAAEQDPGLHAQHVVQPLAALVAPAMADHLGPAWRDRLQNVGSAFLKVVTGGVADELVGAIGKDASTEAAEAATGKLNRHKLQFRVHAVEREVQSLLAELLTSLIRGAGMKPPRAQVA